MRVKFKNKRRLFSNRYLLYTALGLLLIFLLTVNCSPGIQNLSSQGLKNEAESSAATLPEEQDAPLAEAAYNLSDELWADALEGGPQGATKPSGTGNISLELKDANLIDVLSMLAYRMDVNILFLGEPDTITFKSENLSPLTTFQLLLQSYQPTQQAQGTQNDLDYLVLGRNYIVGNRDRLHQNFFNRMLLTRFGLHYVSAEAMESYIQSLDVPVQSLTVDANQQALWVQGTPVTLGKVREVINSLDVLENAAFAAGGSRKIRMPVATAAGARAEEELEALVDLLSILLDGFRDGRTDMGWVTWDHPDPIPYIVMDWNNPVIRPYDIKMKITRDFAGDYSNQIRYLIAEGTAANIDLVNQMIEAIASTPNSPLSFEQFDSGPVADENSRNGQGEQSAGSAGQGGSTLQYVPEIKPMKEVYNTTYTVKVSAVPPEGGSLSGGGVYQEGSLVTVSAQPAAGYQFVRWIENGAQISEAKSTVFYLYSNRALEAVFIKAPPEEAEPADEAALSAQD